VPPPPHERQIHHLLWALFFMKCYPTEELACITAGGPRRAVDQKTLRKHIWPFIIAIADLESHVVSNFIFILNFTLQYSDIFADFI
jgi:hypothetical protein